MFIFTAIPGIVFLLLNRGSKVTVLEEHLRELNEGEINLHNLLSTWTDDGNRNLRNHLQRYFLRLHELLLEANTLAGNNKTLGNSLVKRYDKSLERMQEIGGHLEEVGTNVDSLTKDIHMSNDAVTYILNAIRDLSGLVENQSSAVQVSSSAVEEMNASIQNVARITKERTIDMDDLKKKSAEGNQVIDRTVREIKEVSQQTGTIMELLGMINDVASRTNLLAINASIEAAHAGEKGKGFAVVASEIGKLASTTANNARNITDSLTEITNRMAQVQDFSTASGRIFAEVNEEVHDASQSFQEISSSMEELAIGQHEILKSVQILSDTSHDVHESSIKIKEQTKLINESMASVDKSSQQTETSIKEITTRMENLNEVGMQIMTLIHQNRINMETLSKSIEQMDTGIQENSISEAQIGIKWSQGFSVGVEEMDNQHKKLIKALDDYLIAMVSGKGTDSIKPLLDKLAQYVIEHFSDEEKMMERIQYPDLENHRVIHNKFIDKLKVLSKELEEKGPTPLLATRVQDEVANWLIKHIANSDKLYGKHYNSIYGGKK